MVPMQDAGCAMGARKEGPFQWWLLPFGIPFLWRWVYGFGQLVKTRLFSVGIRRRKDVVGETSWLLLLLLLINHCFVGCSTLLCTSGTVLFYAFFFPCLTFINRPLYKPQGGLEQSPNWINEQNERSGLTIRV